jgi:hypothetical protein
MVPKIITAADMIFKTNVLGLNAAISPTCPKVILSGAGALCFIPRRGYKGHAL